MFKKWYLDNMSHLGGRQLIGNQKFYGFYDRIKRSYRWDMW